MKRIFAIVLVVMMTASLFAMPVSAKPHANTNLMPMAENILDIDFEAATTSDNWRSVLSGNKGTGIQGKFYSNSGGTATVIAEEGNNTYLTPGTGGVSANRIRLYAVSPAGTNDFGAVADYANATSYFLYGSFTTEFKFKLTALPSVAFTLYYADLNTSEGTSPGPNVSISASSQFMVSGSNVLGNGQTILANRWYTVKVVNNILNRTYDVYLNGVLVANDAAFTGGSPNYISTYGTSFTSFNRPFMCDAVNPIICFDDIRIFKEATGRTTFAADDFEGNGQTLTYPFATSGDSDTGNFNADRWQPDFAGLQVDRRYAQQSGVAVTSGMENNYAAISPYAKLRTVLAKNYNSPATDVSLADSLLGQELLTVEFDFTPTAATTGTFYQLTDAQVVHPGWKLRATDGHIYAEAGKYSATADNYISITDLGSYAMDGTQTYRIKVSVDMSAEFSQTVSGSGTLTKKGMANVYIDGKLVGKDLPFAYDCKNNASVTSTNIGSPFVIHGDTTATYYIDNLAVYTDVREKILLDAISALGGKIAGASAALPTTTESGYAITWSSDDITVANNTAVAVCADETRTVTLTASVADAAGQLAVTGSVDVVIPARYELEITYDNATNAPVAGATIESVKFVDNNDATASADVFVAVYTNSGKMLVEAAVALDTLSGIVNPVDITLESGDTVKFFVWSADGSMKPLMNLKTVVIE